MHLLIQIALLHGGDGARQFRKWSAGARQQHTDQQRQRASADCSTN
ncbi:MAG: hypothetical protein U0528_00160 [Anaerolineae bacterium]